MEAALRRYSTSKAQVGALPALRYRYTGRAPMATDRLLLLPDSRLRYRLKRLCPSNWMRLTAIHHHESLSRTMAQERAGR